MNKVISVNLNGNAHQLEEAAYEALRRYLDTAEQRLRGNPDASEITSDVEQAIAEKCARYLGSHKNVITAAEMERILAEMGPVAVDDETTAPATEHSTAQAQGTAAGTPRRLYRIRENEMIDGVCSGLAAYFNVDPTLVRLIFVGLTILTGGGWILAYIVMMFVVPAANTAEERATAHGQPFNTEQLIERAKEQYAEIREQGNRWREGWRMRREERRRRRWQAMHERARWTPPPVDAPRTHYGLQVLSGFLVPIFGILSAALFVAFILILISMVVSGTIFGWMAPQHVPLWVGILTLVLLYNVIAWPLRATRRASYQAAAGADHHRFAAADGIVWLGFTVLFFWLAYEFIPIVHWMFDRLPTSWDRFDAVWNLWL